MPTNYSPTSLQAVQRGAGANMSVDVSIGDVFMPNTAGTYSYYGWTDAITNLGIQAADPTNPRIDVVVAYVDLSVLNPASNNNVGALKFFDVTGTPSGSPSAPNSSAIQTAVGAGNPWTYIAQVAVAANATQIVTANITDKRFPWALRANLWGGSSNTNGHTVPNVADDTVALLNAAQTLKNKTIDSTNSIVWNGWQTPSGTFTYAGNNGNREFLINTSVDLTGVLSPGARLKVTRHTTPPTQSMAFVAASSQYATKASPTGITFTSAFTCEAWVYLNSYPTGSNAGYVVSRYSANGWLFRIEASGQITAYYESSGTTKTFTSAQSLPLKRKVHIAAAVTTGTGTCALYIDGVSVSIGTTSGTATTITPAGNLSVGALGAGTAGTFLDGYLSEVRVWSVAQSQAQIQANMAINLTGSETNLVALYQGPTFNDLTSNANNLTATNGATQVTSYPYNAIEYGIVTKVTSTQLTVFTGTDCTIPNMTLDSPAYSLERTPYGFPVPRNKWKVDLLILSNIAASGGVANTIYNPGGISISVPTGDWKLKADLTIQGTASTNAIDVSSSVSSSSSAPTNYALSARTLINEASTSNLYIIVHGGRSDDISLTTATPFYILLSPRSTVSALAIRGTVGDILNEQSAVTAECAYV